jgi:hypothetical protein
MSVDTHGRWPWAAAGLVAPTWALAAACRQALAHDGLWVAALGFPLLVSHQTEEWVRPGGFLPFCNERLLGSDRPTWPLTERDGFHVNVTLGWSSAIAAKVLWERAPAVAAGVLWLEAGNGLMHSAMAVRERRYNPGVVTGSVLMLPHALLGGRWLARSGRLSRGAGMAAAGAGIAFSAGLPLAMKRRMRERGLSGARTTASDDRAAPEAAARSR